MVTYEWDIETWDYDDDNEIEISDHNFADKLSEFHSDEFLIAVEQGRLVLVRDDDNGRSWAYFNATHTPEYFSILESDGNYYETNMKIPKRFIEEFKKLIDS